jgi:hypothetical protein
MKKNLILGMVAAVVLSISWDAFVQTSGAERATGGPIKECESLKGITVLMPDGSPAVSKNSMLIVDVNREVAEMVRLGPYGPLRSDEKGFLLLPEEVFHSGRKQNSFRKMQRFFPDLLCMASHQIQLF